MLLKIEKKIKKIILNIHIISILLMEQIYDIPEPYNIRNTGLQITENVVNKSTEKTVKTYVKSALYFYNMYFYIKHSITSEEIQEAYELYFSEYKCCFCASRFANVVNLSSPYGPISLNLCNDKINLINFVNKIYSHPPNGIKVLSSKHFDNTFTYKEGHVSWTNVKESVFTYGYKFVKYIESAIINYINDIDIIIKQVQGIKDFEYEYLKTELKKKFNISKSIHKRSPEFNKHKKYVKQYTKYLNTIKWISRIKDNYNDNMEPSTYYQFKVKAIVDSYILYRTCYGVQRGSCPRIQYAPNVIDAIINKDFTKLK